MLKKINRYGLAVAFVGLMGFGAQTPMAATLCTSSNPPLGLSVNDVTFRTEAADDCYGLLTGNDSQHGGNTGLTGITEGFGGTWDYIGTDDSLAQGNLTPTGPITEFGVIWEFYANNDLGTGDNTGTWTLKWTDPDPSNNPPLPITLDIAAVTKASTDWAAYLFEAEDFYVNPNTGTGTWKVSWKANQTAGDFANLSHFSLYARFVGYPDDNGNGNGGGGGQGNGNGNGVPEPATLGLLGLGMLAMGAIRRRKAVRV